MAYTYKYPHPAVTTDCVILTFHEEKLKILLIRRGIEPYKGEWALPGGFLKMDESAEECAKRELREETGVTGSTIKQFYTFTRPDRDPRERVITIAFYALMRWQHAEGADDAEFADWLPVDQLPPLAFDHAEIVKLALETIRRDIFFEPVGFDLLNEIFSMTELQKVYESILGKEFDRRNFAKKMKHLNILEEVSPEPTTETTLVEMSHSDAFDDKFNMFEDLSIFGDAAAPGPEEAPKTEVFCAKKPPMPMAYCAEEPPMPMAFRPLEAPKMMLSRSSKTRKSRWFKFNKKKYDKLKDDDIMEF